MGTYVSIALAVAAAGALLAYLAIGRRTRSGAGEKRAGGAGQVASASQLTSAATARLVDESGPNALIALNTSARTDPGKKRQVNEDSFLVLEDERLFVVADGMGRHAAGEVASQLAARTIERVFRDGEFAIERKGDEAREAHRLRAAAASANQAIFAKASEVDAYHGMGTTLVALHFAKSKQRAAVLNAGDSRCYRLRDGALSQITVDHTLGAAGLKGSNAALLSKAVGIEEALEPDVFTEHPRPEDLYLLCSDGLSRMVPPDEIAKLLQSSRDLAAVSSRLIEVANEAGGRDNVTVILVRVERAAA